LYDDSGRLVQIVQAIDMQFFLLVWRCACCVQPLRRGHLPEA